MVDVKEVDDYLESLWLDIVEEFPDFSVATYPGSLCVWPRTGSVSCIIVSVRWIDGDVDVSFYSPGIDLGAIDISGWTLRTLANLPDRKEILGCIRTIVFGNSRHRYLHDAWEPSL